MAPTQDEPERDEQDGGTQIRRVINKRIRRQDGGVNLVADVQAAINANVGASGATHTRVSSEQRIVQRSGRSQPDADTGQEQERGKAAQATQDTTIDQSN